MKISKRPNSLICTYYNEKLIPIISLILFLILAATLQGQTKDVPLVNLHYASLQGNIDAVNQHIKNGADLNQKDQFGSTPLIIATTFGNTEIAEALIKAGADLKIANSEGSTPLHVAALFCREDIVKVLLENGADINLRDNYSSTPYDIVAAPFETDKKIYDQIGASLSPLGLKLDYENLKSMRPKIADMLHPSRDELEQIGYQPIKRNDWEVSEIQDQNIDPNLVSELYYDASQLKTIYSLLIVKNGNLIAEKYFNEGSIDQLSKRASITKSYVSAMMGIALEKGFIKSINQKMIDYFPELNDQISDARKNQITIENMLQMRAGFPWEETDTSYWNVIWSGKYTDKIDDMPLTKEPDTEFQYSNLTSNWLGIIISRASNNDLKTFGEENLFKQLGVKLGGWIQDFDGYYIGSGDIQFTARDMAKFGLLYLKKGKYNGRQIITADWVEKSLQSYSDNINSAGIVNSRVGRYFHNIGYGYQWWSASAGNHNFNLAWGHGGQFIILLHDLDMVIVATADPFYGKQKHFEGWKFEKSIINVIGKFIQSLPNKI